MSDIFKKVIDSGYAGFETAGARKVIDESIYATKFLEKNLNKLNEYKDFFDDSYLDKALERAHQNGMYDKYQQSLKESNWDDEEVKNEVNTIVPPTQSTEEFTSSQEETIKDETTLDKIDELK